MMLFRVLFYLHLFLIAVLVIFLAIRGFLSAEKDRHFHPLDWYLPLLSSTGCGGIVSLAWHWFTRSSPARALPVALWISPILTCGVGFLLVSIGFPGSLALGILAFVVAVIQSLYACWVRPRLDYGTKVLSASIAPSPPITGFLLPWILAATLYASFLVAGLGGATAAGTAMPAVFILLLLLSLAWTMQVMKNIINVAMARIMCMYFAFGVNIITRGAFSDTFRHSLDSICMGSILCPVLGTIRGSARGMKLVAGGRDEFMFSCANCYSEIASTLITYGNRWGFVHVGFYNKGFVQGSRDAWEMLERAGLERVVDSDITSSFCFLSGVAVGGICSIVGGSWSVAIHKSYATEISVYAFLIGYFLCGIGMAWTQACVSAYYVAYSENPRSALFDSTIPNLIQRFNAYQA